jgi:hypothetical protein
MNAPNDPLLPPQGFLRYGADGEPYLHPINVFVLPESYEYRSIDRCASLSSEDIERLFASLSGSAVGQAKAPRQR